MGKDIISRGLGGPDYIELSRAPSRNVVSSSEQHFTEELAKGGSEQENISGLVSNKIIISNVAINSSQSLHFRLDFYSRGSFTDSDLDEDTFVGSVEIDLARYGRLA